MATKKRPDKQSTSPLQQAAPEKPAGMPPSILSHKLIPYLIILLFSTGIYFNSVWNTYALDDSAVLVDNKFTRRGFDGIHDILTKDALVGYLGDKNINLSGGRYRPLSMVTLAIEVQLFGLNPVVSHFVNVMLFALTCLLLYHLLCRLMPPGRGSPFYVSYPFHRSYAICRTPIHTEAVANIKGRDEIMAMLFSLAALYAAVQYVSTNKPLHLVWGVIAFFLALMSKENAVTFLVIIPLTYYFFTDARWKQYVAVLLYLLPLGLFLYLRWTYTYSGQAPITNDVLNYPFALLPDTTDGHMTQYATIVYSFLLYLKQLVFPLHLSHDYFYDQIHYVSVSSLSFILSLGINLALIGYAVYGTVKKSVAAYAILFYYITFSIVSNVVFTVGVIMSERYVFMGSMGICLLAAYMLVAAREKYKLPQSLVTSVVVTVLALFSIKTIARNAAWHDNLTLFVTDAKVSTRSTKVNTAAGGEVYGLADKNLDSLRTNGRLQHFLALLDMQTGMNIPDTTLRTQIRKRALQYLDTAIAIHPVYTNAWMLHGVVSSKLGANPNNVIVDYRNALQYSMGQYFEAWYNMGCAQLSINMPVQAKQSFFSALQLDPASSLARYNLGESYYLLHMPDSALYWYGKTLEVQPKDDKAYYKIATVYGRQLNNLDMAISNITKAIEYNPDVPLYYEDLAVAYAMSHRYDDAIAVCNKCLLKFPTYAPAYANMAYAYRDKGDMKSAEMYMQKAQQLSAAR